MSTDKFGAQQDLVSNPARMAFAITPHDTNEVNPLPKAIYIGTGGTVVLQAADSPATATFQNVASGQILDVRALVVKATGTTASNIVGLA